MLGWLFGVWRGLLDIRMLSTEIDFAASRTAAGANTKQTYTNTSLQSVTYFSRYSRATAGMVEISNQMQPQTHKTSAINDRIGDSHSKQLLGKGWQRESKKKKPLISGRIRSELGFVYVGSLSM